MLKKVFLITLVCLGILYSMGFGFKALNLWGMVNWKEDEAMVSENIPFGIEKNNPVPEVKHWDLGEKTYYYFNWGLKPTGGYSLELLDAQDNLLKIKAHTPQKGQMLIQSFTFPYLLLVLPQGRYRYTVVNEAGEQMSDIFVPQNPPLKMTIFLPRNGQVAKREILREPATLIKAKAPALLALESLFNQEEMLDYVNRGVLPKKTVFSDPEHKWYVLLSKAYESLNTDEQSLLHEIISKTILTLAANNLATVEIVTDASVLKPEK
jgi:hypothetical protein